MGTTDDASSLREIYKGISSKQKSQIKNKKEYKIIFEITDGASTFPGATKDIVKKTNRNRCRNICNSNREN